MTEDHKHQAVTVALARASAGPASHVRETLVAGEHALQISPDSLAGTIGVAKAVASPEQLAAVSPGERYMPIRELGRGGMGRVDVVFDRALGRPVAQKTVLEPRHAGLLVAEAQICAQLEHPSIVPVYDLGSAAGAPVYTMRVVRGRTLRDVLDANERADGPRMGLTQLLGVLRQVCLAVDYAHSRGVVHRDLKPENVIVGEFGEVYVLDWGVAHVSPGSDINRSGALGPELTVAGSPGYMAPEQALGEEIGARTDLFALGVILYEVLSGRAPFEDRDLGSILRRIGRQTFPPPSAVDAARGIPAVFDPLVRACLRKDPAERPPSARFVADAIDAFLDGARARVERAREAAEHTLEGERARDAFEALDGEALRLWSDAETALAALRPWEPVERKLTAWNRLEQSRRLAAEAARALARAEAAFARALGRVPDHRRARAGLASLHFRQFESAEARGEPERMAQYLDLARAYDDGALELELANEGTLVVETTQPGEVTVARYEAAGVLLRAATARPLAPDEVIRLESGSYVVVARTEHAEVRYPLVIRRAQGHRLRLRIPHPGEVPEDMILIPGGPFMTFPSRSHRAIAAHLPDFAIGRFPVTFREYSRFLTSIEDEDQRKKRTPGFVDVGALLLRSAAGEGWVLSPRCVEGEARKHIPAGRELDLPVHQISWYSATAYARWVATTTNRPYRLATDLEWEKAMRGADGRAFPMGNQLDPAFAKLRESRPEAPQPEPVGAFSLDESPYGVRDLAGGVGDWTSTSVDGAALPTLAAEGSAAADERQAVWRGGNWGSSATGQAMRYPMKLTARSGGVGFRLALSLDQNDGSELVVEPMKRG